MFEGGGGGEGLTQEHAPLPTLPPTDPPTLLPTHAHPHTHLQRQAPLPPLLKGRDEGCEGNYVGAAPLRLHLLKHLVSLLPLGACGWVGELR